LIGSRTLRVVRAAIDHLGRGGRKVHHVHGWNAADALVVGPDRLGDAARVIDHQQHLLRTDGGARIDGGQRDQTDHDRAAIHGGLPGGK
jgi:hypothetical protein